MLEPVDVSFETDEEVLERLRRALARSDRFHLYFVISPLGEARQALIGSLVEDVAVALRIGGAVTMDYLVLAIPEVQRLDRPVILYGFEGWMSEGDEGTQRFLHDLNFQRDRLGSLLQHPLILWGSPDILRLFSSYAPDLKSVASGIFLFPSTATRRLFREDERVPPHSLKDLGGIKERLAFAHTRGAYDGLAKDAETLASWGRGENRVDEVVAELIAVADAVDSSDPLTAASIRIIAAELLTSEGRLKEAEDLFEAVTPTADTVPRGHPLMASLLRATSRWLVQRGDFNEAYRALLATLDGLKARGIEGRAAVLDVHRDIARLHQAQGRLEDAFLIRKRIVLEVGDLFGEGSEEYAEALEELAEAAVRSGKEMGARDALTSALKIRRAQGKRTVALVQDLINLAIQSSAHEREALLEEAERLLEDMPSAASYLGPLLQQTRSSTRKELAIPSL
ncbi:hypothetical protein BH11ARM2_BH11ARM2_09720 [soil metagenome]